ncbi:hypothetical protein P7L53_08495 [Thermoleptolyngbya sichuanensis XZ-Cy5]|uniref:hypothetical protein n=1 Tax=Thermoleptolyngbya sichuanensis TaxID=2885951 RepID=UPI00240DF19E|nr:hypothetical protein [Thermoleptolyngbya sichuanensis]MDG2616282.1 hypothetical protein [Thermoleptolyngbya sichuanensis XZ-Cy5]
MSNPDYSRQNETRIRDMQNAELQNRELRDRELHAYEARRQAEIARDNANTSGGLFLGLMLAAIAGFTTLFIALAQRSDTQPQVEPAAPPEVNVQPPEVNVQPPDVNIQQAPPPDVNVTIPETAPQTAPPQSADPSLDPMMGAPESSTDSMNPDSMNPDSMNTDPMANPNSTVQPGQP